MNLYRKRNSSAFARKRNRQQQKIVAEFFSKAIQPGTFFAGIRAWGRVFGFWLIETTVMEQSEQITAALQRDLNCLSDPDRSVRRRALERLQKQLLHSEMSCSSISLVDLQVAWDDTILKNVLKALSDSVEKCRELAINLISEIGNKIPKADQTVALVVPVIAQRMGQLPLRESSEEVRLQLMNFICSGCITRCSEITLKLVAEHLTQILCISLRDQFHEIKKGASRAIVMLTEHACDVYSEMSEQLLKALLPNIGHTHSKVRIATLQAINSVVFCGLPAGMVADVLVPSIKILALDHTIGVRELLFEYIAGWLGYTVDIKGPEYRQCIKDMVDPRTYASSLLPLLLLGLSDESADVAEKTLQLVEGVGEVYLKFEHPTEAEHAEMVGTESVNRPFESDKLNGDGFAENEKIREEVRSHSVYSAGLKLPPPFKGRPGKGCRMMVQAYLGQLIYPAHKDLKQWTAAVRIGAARLLPALLVLAEEKAADYLDILISCLCSAVGDDDLAVARHTINAVHVLGYHVSPDFWLLSVLDQVIPSRLSQAQVANGLVVLAGLLYGMPAHAIKESTIVEISKQICHANLGLSDHPAIKQQLLAVLENLVEKGRALCQSSSLELCLLLLQLQSLNDDKQAHQQAAMMVDKLAREVGLTSGKALYARHTEALLRIIIAGHPEWSGNSSGAFLFQTFLEKAGSAVSPYLGTLLQVFSDCLNAERDPVLRLNLVQLLDKLFEVNDMDIWWKPVALQTIGGILLPCSVWHIGKVAAAIRHGAMVALGTFLRRDLCSQEHLVVLLRSQQLLPIVTSCLEEDYYTDTRRVSCHVIEHILRIAGSDLDDEQTSAMTKSLQKRLDDSSDAVRLGILPAISNLLSTVSLSNRCIDVPGFLSNLILHMDDPNEQIQEGVYTVIKDYASCRPEIVLEVVKGAQERHQNVKCCKQLLEFVASKQAGPVQ